MVLAEFTFFARNCLHFWPIALCSLSAMAVLLHTKQARGACCTCAGARPSAAKQDAHNSEPSHVYMICFDLLEVAFLPHLQVGSSDLRRSRTGGTGLGVQQPTCPASLSTTCHVNGYCMCKKTRKTYRLF